MIRFLLSLLPWWVWALILSGLAACAGIAVWRTATAVADARWLAGQAAAQEQARNDELVRSRKARDASTSFEAWRAAAARREQENRDALSYALRTPISCPASGDLADVLVPAAAVGELRAAGQSTAAAPGASAPQPSD